MDTMSGGYCKLFTDIVTSTIWQRPNACRVLWVTMLALKDETNICRATVPALAKICDISIEECESYLQEFQSPDEHSRSQEFEGRRIERVDGGYLLLNGQKYRDMLRGQERRDYIRDKVAEHRKRVNKSKHGNQCKPIAEAEAEAEVQAIPDKLRCNEEFLRKWEAWKAVRRAKKKCKDFHLLFQEQLNWLATFTVPQAIECLAQSIRNDWQGLFPPKTSGNHQSDNGKLAPIDKAILQKEKDLIVARLATLRSQYDGHQSWSEKDKIEAHKLKPRLADINGQLGCLL